MFYQLLLLGGFESRHKIRREFLYHCQKYIDLRMGARTGNALHHPIHPASSCLAVSAHVTATYLVEVDSTQSGLQCQLVDGAYVGRQGCFLASRTSCMVDVVRPNRQGILIVNMKFVGVTVT